jgi:N-acylneuraminate cytidylyltransferase
MIIALVPMKGHSERVPDKNIRLLAGKPLFFFIIENLLKTSKISNVIINTDSERIAELATNEFGQSVEISWRPEELSGDFIPMNKIIEYELKDAGTDQHFLQTHSTNPFLKTTAINKAIEHYYEKITSGESNSIFSVTEIHSRLYNSNLQPLNHNTHELIRTQDLEPIYKENSNFYLFSKESFLKTKRRIGRKPGVFVMDSLEGFDIDTPQY